MIRRRYLAGIFVKVQVKSFAALSAERGAQIVTVLNLENQDSLINKAKVFSANKEKKKK